MHRYFLILLIITCTPSAYAQLVNNDHAFYNYTYDKEQIKKNKIKTITTQTNAEYYGRNSRSTYFFTRNGILQKNERKDSTGTLTLERFFYVDDHANLLKIVSKDFEYSTIDSIMFFRKYDKELVSFDSSGLLPQANYYKYNQDGQLVQTLTRIRFFSNATTEKIITYEVDHTGNPIHIIEVLYENRSDTVGSIRSDRMVEYNNLGKRTKEIEKIVSGNFVPINQGSITYEYDADGNLLRVLRSNAASYNYKYNAAGLLVEETMGLHIDDLDADLITKYSYSFW